VREKLNAFRWLLGRLAFIVYIFFSVVTVIGGFLTAPLMTWYFFGDWRFWRHWRAGKRLLPHGLRMLALMFDQKRAFMFSVPLTSPPRSTPDSSIAHFRVDWPHGDSCGECTNCCKVGDNVCPLLDEQQHACRGYNSFYWRYFNCGRYPSVEEQIHYYDCRKWVLTKPGLAAGGAGSGVAPGLGIPVGAVRQKEY
jgi:hypothetical protein